MTVISRDLTLKTIDHLIDNDYDIAGVQVAFSDLWKIEMICNEIDAGVSRYSYIIVEGIIDSAKANRVYDKNALSKILSKNKNLAPYVDLVLEGADITEMAAVDVLHDLKHNEFQILDNFLEVINGRDSET